MYELNGKVRYSEIDTSSTLTYSGLMNYFQDCSAFHSETLQVGLRYLEQHNMTWVLSFWQICINKLPNFGDKIIVQTWPYKMQGLYGMRNFSMNNRKGERLAYANSIWVLVDVTTGRPIRLTDDIHAFYPDEPQLEMEYCDRKISIPKEYEEKQPILVQKYFIDTNQHVNNEKYVMIAQEFVPQDFKIREIRAEYKKAAILNDVLFPRVTIEQDSVTVMLGDENGKPYATILFLQ
ncbi:MAG: hypothetical protein IKJ01_07450 [Lachnospiraceae bacterium]|nr:hypothetical protein [Lachnospiraceae bacterium]